MPKLDPQTVRAVITILGMTLTTIALADQFSWQVALSALGGAIATWVRTGYNSVAIETLPVDLQKRVSDRPPAPPKPSDLGDE